MLGAPDDAADWAAAAAASGRVETPLSGVPLIRTPEHFPRRGTTNALAV